MTISVGFRAPSYESLLTAFCAHVVDTTGAKTRYIEDTSLIDDFERGVGAGMISPSVQSLVTESLDQHVRY